MVIKIDHSVPDHTCFLDCVTCWTFKQTDRNLMSTLDDIMNEMGVKSQTQDSKNYTMDDLDDLMAEVESQETRRRAPLTKQVKEATSARKTTTRKSPNGALEDNDLDAVLDIIINSANKKNTEKKNEIGWGVINAVCILYSSTSSLN